MVDRVVEVRWRDLAGRDAFQRIRARDAFEVQVREQVVRRLAERDDAGPPEAVGQAQAGEAAAQRIADEGREARRGLAVVEDVLPPQLVEQRDQVGSREDRGLAGLVEAEAAGEDRETRLDRLVEQVRFRVPELEDALAAAELRVERQRFAEPQEVVRGVAEADEAAGEAGHAAVQVDHVAAPLLDLQREIDEALARVARDHGIGLGPLRLDRIEVAQLVQAQHADVPQAGVEHVPFVEQELPPDHLVARGRIALELDAPDEELLAFVHGQVEVDLRRGLVLAEFEAGFGHEIDVAEFPVELLEVLHALAQLLDVEDGAFLHREDRAQHLVGHAEEFHVREAQLAALVALPFLDQEVDVGVLLGLVEEHRPGDQEGAPARGVAHVEVMLEHVRLEVAPLLVGVPQALLVLLELADVEGAREQALEHQAVGNPERLGVLHGPPGALAAEHVEAFEADLAHLDLRAFVDVEDDLHRRGRNLADFRRDDGVLAAPLAQQFAEDEGGAVDRRRIVPGLDREPDIAFLEAFQDVRQGRGLVAFVPDRADHAPLGHHEAHDLADLAVLDLEPQVVEIAGVPEHHEIPAQRLRVVQVPALGEDPGGKAVARNPARAAEHDFLDEGLALPALLRRLLDLVERGGLVRRFERNLLERRNRLLRLREQIRPRLGRLLAGRRAGSRVLRERGGGES